eukprot:1148429-Pelagomonas_calceolata.AAC.1
MIGSAKQCAQMILWLSLYGSWQAVVPADWCQQIVLGTSLPCCKWTLLSGAKGRAFIHVGYLAANGSLTCPCLASAVKYMQPYSSTQGACAECKNEKGSAAIAG